jgi:hypothetical protein
MHKVSRTTTINIDEEKRKRIKRAVQNINDDSRSLTELMGDASESFDAEAILEAFTRKMGWEAIDYPSLREVEERRPTSTEGSTKIIREMRESRADRVS